MLAPIKQKRPSEKFAPESDISNEWIIEWMEF